MDPHETSPYNFYWLTPDRWADFETLFGPKGAYGGCWCMFWRQTQSEYDRNCGQPNKEAFHAIVNAGERPGILAYAGNMPVGWAALAPRETYSRLARSRVLTPVDEASVWSITCFYVAKGWRRKGLTVELLRAAVDMVGERGGQILEGYPVEPKKGQTADIYAYTGLASAFRKAGFVEVARRSETRPIMRSVIAEGAGGLVLKNANQS